MALYVSLVAAAEFAVLGHHTANAEVVASAIWGTALGLTIAHVFSFDLAGRLFGDGHLDSEGRSSVWLQAAAAIIVAAVLTIPLILFEVPTAVDVDGYLVAGLVGVTAYAVSRSAGRSRARAVVFGAGMLLPAICVVSIKVAFSGH